MRVRFPVAAAIAAAGFLTISCGGIIDPSKNVTETFSGAISPGQVFGPHKFSVPNTGEFTVKITALSPSGNVFLGIEMDQASSDGTCTAAIQRVNAALNVLAMNGQIFSGKYCLFVYDVGAVTTATTYTLTVSHP
jgi:hypothetical protein